MYTIYHHGHIFEYEIYIYIIISAISEHGDFGCDFVLFLLSVSVSVHLLLN